MQGTIEIVKAAVAEVLAAQGVVDSQARDDARDALQAIQSHERVCVERAETAKYQREATQDKIDAVKTDIGKLFKLLWWAMTSVIVLLLGIVGFLLPRAVHFG